MTITYAQIPAQLGTTHEFRSEATAYHPDQCFEVDILHPMIPDVSFDTAHTDDTLVILDLPNLKILRDILTEHIARQERGNPA